MVNYLLNQPAASGALLKKALIASLVVHMALLTVRFTMPRFKQPELPSLEVILVNSQSQTAPKEPDALAQVALSGGGDKKEGRAKSPLPSASSTKQNPSLSEVQAQLDALEQQQKQLKQQASGGKQAELTRPVPGNKTPVDTPSTDKPDTTVTPQKKLDVQDLMASAKEIARLEAQVSRQVEDYNKRPRKHFFSPSTSPYAFAMYEEAWRNKVERFGNLNYPEEAKGKLYGQLRMTVYIRADGTMDNVDIEIDKPSGYPALDRAAMKIVRMSAPFAKFPPEMASQIDILAISRTWVFTNNLLETKNK